MKKTKFVGSGSLIIGYDFTNGDDKSVLLVGQKRLGQSVEIIKSFQGKEAEELYLELTTKTGGEA